MPLQRLAYGVRSMVTNNPLTMARRGLMTFRQQIGYYMRLPMHYLNMLLPPGMRNNLKLPGIGGLNKPDVGDVRGDMRDDLKDLGKSDDISRGARVKTVPRRAQFSQIHLIEQQAGIRHILHIGTIVGQSASDIKLDNPLHGLVRLRFSQVDPKLYNNAPMLLTYLSGATALEVQGIVTQGSVPIHNYTPISINGVNYQIEFYAYDRVPIVTRVDAAWITDVGPVRDVNEDAVGIYQHSDGYMFVLADGVGGGYAGDEVSAFSVQYLLTVFQKNFKNNVPWSDTLSKAYAYINAEVRQFFLKSPHPTGSTLTCAVIKNWQAHIGHVGDSVLYLYRNWSLEQLTTDHSELITVGYETEGEKPEGETPTTRNMLRKAIGKADTIQPDIFTLQLQPGDKLLFCSDGLSGVVPKTEIMEALELPKPSLTAKKLLELAYQHQTTDNVSLIVVDVLEEPYERDSWTVRSDDRVYVSGRLPVVPRLKKPREMNTIYSIMTSWGCFVTGLVLLFVIGLIGFYRSQAAQNVVLEPTQEITPEVTASPDVTSEIVATSEVIVTPTVEEPTALPEASQPEVTQPETTSTPESIETEQETVPAGDVPTVTLVRPTSTLRASRNSS